MADVLKKGTSLGPTLFSCVVVVGEKERKTDKFESTRLDGINQSTTAQIDKRQAGYKGQYQANLFTGIDDNEIKDLRHSIVERDRRGKSLYLPLVWVTSLQLLLFLFA